MVGIFAFQGDFERHAARLSELGAPWKFVKHIEALDEISSLVIPGGESTTFLRTTSPEFRDRLKTRIESGMPVLATCAGVILLAAHVTNPSQQSLGLLDIDVTRNAYGRQVDSFVDRDMRWTAAGRDYVLGQGKTPGRKDGAAPHHSRLELAAESTLEGVFIRAPRISRVGTGVEVLVECRDDPVLVRQGKILAATFHPELSAQATAVHELFLSLLASE